MNARNAKQVVFMKSPIYISRENLQGLCDILSLRAGSQPPFMTFQGPLPIGNRSTFPRLHHIDHEEGWIRPLRTQRHVFQSPCRGSYSRVKSYISKKRTRQ